MDVNVVTARIGPQAVVYRRATLPLREAASFLAGTMAAAHAALRAAGVKPKAGPYTRTLRIHPDGTAEVEAGFPVNGPVGGLADGLENGHLPGGTVMQAVHKGPVDKVAETQNEMLRQLIATAHLVQDGPGWVYHLTSPADTAPEAMRALAVMPIRERNARAAMTRQILEALPGALPQRVA